MKTALIIFSGFNQRAVFAFLRTIYARDVDYAIIAKSEEDTIFLSDYKDKVLAVRKSVALDINDILSSIKKVQKQMNADKCLIAPSTEGLNRFILEHRSVLEVNNIEIPLVSKSLYELLSDKYSFSAICQKNDILIPQEYDDINNTLIPFIAKSSQYLGKEGKAFSPIPIFTEEEKQSFLQDYDTKDFFFQEYLIGESYYLLYYFNKNGTIYEFSQKNIAQQPEGKSIVAAIPALIHKEIISDQYKKLLSNLHFYGLIMIEVKRCNQQYYMIEANPRFWGPSQLFVDAQMNFFEAFLYDYKLINTPPNFDHINQNIYYFWYGGISQINRKGGKIVFHEKNGEFNIDSWLINDIYLRKDTLSIFKDELR